MRNKNKKMHEDDNKHNVKNGMQKKKEKCKRNKMHEHNTKEMECKRK